MQASTRCLVDIPTQNSWSYALSLQITRIPTDTRNSSMDIHPKLKVPPKIKPGHALQLNARAFVKIDFDERLQAAAENLRIANTSIVTSIQSLISSVPTISSKDSKVKLSYQEYLPRNTCTRENIKRLYRMVCNAPSYVPRLFLSRPSGI